MSNVSAAVAHSGTQHNTANNVFGNAPSTISGKNTAVRVFNLYQAEARSGDHHFDDLVPEDVENDNLEDLVTSLAHYMGHVPIPQGNNTGKILGSESLGQYFGRIMVLLQEKFPKHEAWADDTWSKSLKAGLIRAAQRREIQGTDGEYKDPKIRSLYKRVMPQLVRVSERNFDGWKELQGADLESINRSLIREAGRQAPENFFMRAVINITALGVGRGGEAKFLRYDNWLYDSYFESPDTIWSQLKTMMSAPLLWAPDRYCYLVDFYHSFAAYYLVENGLYRDPTMNTTTQKYVFPLLHNVSNSYVTTKITKTLRAHCADQLKESTSAKSLRRGMNTFLAVHRQISPEEQRTRGAWSSGVTSDKYTENTPSLTLPGALAFGDWPDIHEHVYPPRIECLQQYPGELDSVQQLMNCMYIISVPQFLVGGSLRPFLHTCTAVAIMYHSAMLNDFGAGNSMVSAMIRASEAAGIASSSPTGTSVNDVLVCWGKAIHKDFEARNKMVASAEDLSKDQVIHQLSIQVQDLSQTVRRDQEERIVMRGTIAQLAEEARKSNALIEEFLGYFRNKRGIPDDSVAIASPPKRQRVTGNGDDASRLVQSSTSEGNSKPISSLSNLLTTESELFKAGEVGSSKNILASTLLRDLFAGGHLSGGTALTSTMLNYIPRENQHFYKAVMMLIEMVLTDKQKALLRTKKKEIPCVDVTQLENTLHSIDEACKKKMADLEGKKVGKTKATMTGLGSCYIAWKRKQKPKQQTNKQTNLHHLCREL
jgi:hypothetical protein